MQDLVFFKTSAQTVVASGSDFAFTDGHGIMALSDYYDDLADLEQVPWNVINARYWTDFPDGSRLRQSEFLVYKSFNWSLVEVVGVYNQEMKERVEQLTANLQQPPVVEVRRNWYF
jgi:predicted RNA-binding protein with PUA-like domain